MENTPSANRLHIGIFGRCNSGKSSLLNALAGQRTAIVSALPGTTADPVNKPMELPGIGPVVLSDTAGFDDSSSLGEARCEQTRRMAERTDIALMVCTSASCDAEAQWVERFRERGIPVIIVLNKSDLLDNPAVTVSAIEARLGTAPVVVSALYDSGITKLIEAIAAFMQEETVSLTGDLVRPGDVVLLVMPQDEAAPKGRLILPQVQTLRELLDKGCTAVCCTPGEMDQTLRNLVSPPRLIVTDSQAFAAVSALTPPGSLLTSFSVLYAGYKGEIGSLVGGAAAIGTLTARSRVLIAEACTHAPAGEDIGRVKLPRLLRAKAGGEMRIDTVAGDDFPDDLTPYDLVIHCGGCMFNRRHMLSRIARAAAQKVPFTNYGMAIAALMGILDRVVYPGKAEKTELLLRNPD